MKIANFDIPAVMDCACCRNVFEIDDGGEPGNPDHPYYHKWICDKCMDKIGDDYTCTSSKKEDHTGCGT